MVATKVQFWISLFSLQQKNDLNSEARAILTTPLCFVAIQCSLLTPSEEAIRTGKEEWDKGLELAKAAGLACVEMTTVTEELAYPAWHLEAELNKQFE